jgi:hypothetical protein
VVPEAGRVRYMSRIGLRCFGSSPRPAEMDRITKEEWMLRSTASLGETRLRGNEEEVQRFSRRLPCTISVDFKRGRWDEMLDDE